MTRRRLFALRATVLTLTALSGLAVAELVARATYGPGFLSVVDPYEHHPYRANIEVTDAYGRWFFTNSIGWKDSRPRRKIKLDPSPERRIVFLGDSFTEGLGLPQEQTFSFDVEQRLNRSGGRRVEVLNGGRVSYSPLLEYMRLKKFLAEGYRADTVVLLPDLSDVQDELDYAPEFDFSASGEPLHLRSGNYTSAVRWIYNRSALARWVRRFQLQWQGRLPVAETAHAEREITLPPADAALLRAPGPLTAEAYSHLSGSARALLRLTWSDHLPSIEGWAGDGLRSMQKYIVKIRTLTRQNRMGLIVVIYPTPAVLYTHDDPAYYAVLRRTFPKWFHERELILGTSPSSGAVAYRQAIREICDEHSIPFVDLFPAFQQVREWHRLFLPGDVHFGVEGHRLAGREIAEAIRRNEGKDSFR
jgi:lysophospholipase L1-like esterase